MHKKIGNDRYKQCDVESLSVIASAVQHTTTHMLSAKNTDISIYFFNDKAYFFLLFVGE